MEPGSENEQQQPHRQQQQQQAPPAALGQPTATSKRVYNETLAAQQAARREAAQRQRREQESAARTERRRRQQAYDQAIKARLARAQARRSTVDELARYDSGWQAGPGFGQRSTFQPGAALWTNLPKRFRIAGMHLDYVRGYRGGLSSVDELGMWSQRSGGLLAVLQL